MRTLNASILLLLLFPAVGCHQKIASENAGRTTSERLIGYLFASPTPGEPVFVFSPDTRRIAYGAKTGAKLFVVVDDKEEKSYDGIGKGTPIFSPDSRRVAYWVKAGAKLFVVVDGKEEKSYDGVADIIFSPDSQRVAYGAAVGGKSFVVVGGKEGKPYDGFPRGARIVFDAANALHYISNNRQIAQGNYDVYLVEETID